MSFLIKIDNELFLKLYDEKDTKIVLNLVKKNLQHLKTWFPLIDKDTTLRNSNDINFGIWHKEKLVGSIILKPDSINQKAKIRYWIDSDYEGRGIMTKCTKAIINYGFHKLNLNRIEIRCSALNKKSQSIPKKLGFTLEATLREDHKIKNPETGTEFTDGLIFGILKKEWLFD